MGLGGFLKKIFIYEEPGEYDPFELLEDETEGGDDQAESDQKDILTKGESVKDKSKGKFAGKISKWLQGESKAETDQDSQDNQDNPGGQGIDKVAKKLQINLDIIKSEFNSPNNMDIVTREFKVLQRADGFLVYIEGMVNDSTINDYILRQLLGGQDVDAHPKGNAIDYIVNNLLATNQITIETKYKEIINQVLNGLTALFIDGYAQCLLIETRGYEKRSVSPPLTETVVLGSQEGFIENLRTNVTLVRRIIRNKDLVTEIMSVGKVSNTGCALLYLNNIANSRIIAEVKRRINSVDVDFISSNGTLDQLIEDHPFSLFPQILNTERPDRVAAFLIEGNVAIICDGSPYASIVPATFFHMLHTSEDSALRWQYGTFLRILRTIAAIVTVSLPGLYLAATLYHHEMIPSELLISLLEARENLPFPVVVELLLMKFSWELIREAGIRVPGVVGQTLGIIGAVILGEAAVAAGLVSPILIIIIAITGLGAFSIPNFSLAFGFRILRFAFTFFGAIAGFYGIAVGVFIFGGLASKMKSFGVPYFSPVAPRTKSSPDIILRAPTWMQKKRPDDMNPQKIQRTSGLMRGWVKGKGKGGKS